MKSLVLAEKPSVARDIARVLGCKGGAGFLESNKYIVTWALGHLITLAEPEHYSERYKNWELETLPIIPKKMDLVVINKTAKQYGIVKQLIHRKDVQEIVIATDAGREGELVARWILEKAGAQKPVKRLWISSVTDKSIKEGFSRLKDGNGYYSLYRSAEARAMADWLVGINATRALTAKFNAQLSCGRVQTPTLAIINSAEEEIRNFVPKTYYELTAAIRHSGQSMIFFWHDDRNERRIFDKEKCETLLLSLKDKRLEIKDISYQTKKLYPPKLYNLTELQQDANDRFGYSSKETLNIMQKLYEEHKVLTYPRTDSKYISQDIIPTIPERLRALPSGEYSRMAAKIKNIKENSNFVDNKKVTDHHAIIPTEESVFLNKMTDKERKIYDLVIKRFLAVLCEPCEYQEISIKAQIGKEHFSAGGKRILSMGFREILGTSNEGESIPELSKGKYDVMALKYLKGQTAPPKPMTEATLLAAMENPTKYLKTKSMAGALLEAGGLGTVATRADIIEKLFDSFYIEKRGRDIYMTQKGKQLLSIAPEGLTKPELTAKWETELDKISKGRQKEGQFINEIIAYTHEVVNEIKASQKNYRHHNMTAAKCPQCGKNLLDVAGKRGKMLVCPDKECGYRKQTSMLTNARCLKCHKKMELTGEGEHKRFVCLCGYSEKLSSFKDRREQEGDKVSKKEVEKFLKNQVEEKTVNKSIAEALKDFNF